MGVGRLVVQDLGLQVEGTIEQSSLQRDVVSIVPFLFGRLGAILQISPNPRLRKGEKGTYTRSSSE